MIGKYVLSKPFFLHEMRQINVNKILCQLHNTRKIYFYLWINFTKKYNIFSGWSLHQTQHCSNKQYCEAYGFISTAVAKTTYFV